VDFKQQNYLKQIPASLWELNCSRAQNILHFGAKNVINGFLSGDCEV
jgi:hypothetical protein